MAGCPFSGSHGASRRGFLAAAGTLLAAGAAAAATPEMRAKGITPASQGEGRLLTVPFDGVHQAGIATALQNHTCFCAFDVTTTDRAALAALMQRWTAAARRMSAADTAAPLSPDLSKPATDSGDAIGLAPARLTITFGFGPTLFEKDGHDRLGLARHRPAELVELPNFVGDQLQPARTGGDLSVQACADDPQVAFHAVRQLANMAYGIAELRWMQTGFVSNAAANDTPRNLMGFKDGTQNPIAAQPVERVAATVITPGSFDDVVWVAPDAGGNGGWMANGSYVVARRVRIALEHWDRTETDFQEQVIGRHKRSGAPLGKQNEFDPLDLDAVDADGNPVIPENAHVRLAAAASNGGAQMLRRSYSYNDGASFTAERWPPWKQGMEWDAGLLFISYQRDSASFIRMFDKMAKLDALNQFVTHTGGGLFACPGGVSGERYIGQALFEA